MGRIWLDGVNSYQLNALDVKPSWRTSSTYFSVQPQVHGKNKTPVSKNYTTGKSKAPSLDYMIMLSYSI